MRFSWPIKDFLGAPLRQQLEALAASELIEGSARDGLREQLRSYEEARDALIAMTLEESETRYVAERRLIILRDELVQTVKPLLREWLAGRVF